MKYRKNIKGIRQRHPRWHRPSLWTYGSNPGGTAAIIGPGKQQFHDNPTRRCPPPKIANRTLSHQRIDVLWRKRNGI